VNILILLQQNLCGTTEIDRIAPNGVCYLSSQTRQMTGPAKAIVGLAI